jgi:hypothetical protein
MQRERFLVVLAIVSFVLISSREAHSQSPEPDGHKFEVGGQFTLIRLPSRTDVSVVAIDCFPAPCPNPIRSNVALRRKTDPGGGGRFGYNFSRHVALEAEGNFFPGNRDAEAGRDGRKLQVLVGVKVGKRFDKVGLFAKARPGFVRYQKGDYRSKPDSLCITIFPPPIGCFQPVAKTNFAFDLGGVIEWYPSKHVLLRFDAGDTFINFGNRNVAATDVSPGGLVRQVVIARPSEKTHSFQGSTGIAFRF